MRVTQKLFPILLCAIAITAGCGRDAEQARVVDEEAGSRAAETRPAEAPKGYVIEEPAPEASEDSASAELRRSPVVDIDQATRPSPDAGREAELAARERRLEQRQADLAARERQLRQREQPERSTRPAQPERTDPSDEIIAAEDTAEVTEISQPVEIEPAVEAPPEEPERPRTAAATVPAGTVLEVELLEGLASDTARVGETFRARVVSDVRADGEVAVPGGSEVIGVVDEVVPLRKVGGRAKIALRFTDLVLPSGATVPLRASLIQQGRSETKKDAATIGGATAGGAILGRILSGRGDRTRGAVIGAVIGAAAGTAVASRTPGEEVVLAEGTVVHLSLDDDVEIRSRR